MSFITPLGTGNLKSRTDKHSSLWNYRVDPCLPLPTLLASSISWLIEAKLQCLPECSYSNLFPLCLLCFVLFLLVHVHAHVSFYTPYDLNTDNYISNNPTSNVCGNQDLDFSILLGRRQFNPTKWSNSSFNSFTTVFKSWILQYPPFVCFLLYFFLSNTCY